MTDPQWQRVCILCSQRGKTRRLESGHCCVECAAWLTTQVADIARLAADAAAWVTPGSSAGGGGHSVPSSRPPLNVDAVDPELTLTGPAPSPTVLEVVESWERMIRESRGMSPYGPASMARTQAIARSEPGGLYAGTSATLVGCIDFLGRSVAWITTTPDFPLEDFADEIRACVRVLRRYDPTLEDMGYAVPCPTLLDDYVRDDHGEPVLDADGNPEWATCGKRLHVRSLVQIEGRDDHDPPVTCPSCRVQREAGQLIAATIDDAYLPANMIADRLGIPEGTIRRWAAGDKVERKGRKYRFGDVRRLAIERRLRRGA